MTSPQTHPQDRRLTTGNLVSGPTRSCLACRRRESKASLTRFTISGGTVVEDPSAALPGRGAYLCHRSSCWDEALARGAIRLRKALRAETGTTIDEAAIRAACSTNAQDEASGVTDAGRSHSAGDSE